MTIFQRIRNSLALTAVATLALPLCLIASPASVRAEEPAAKPEAKEPAADTDAPATPAKIEKADKKAEVSADAQAVLDKVRDGYKQLNGLSLKGSIHADLELNGEKRDETNNFTSSFQSPNKFRHEMDKDILVGSTGEKAFAFKIDANAYYMGDAPKDRVSAKDLPGPIGKLLDQQNPSLLLALAPDAGAQLADGVMKVEKADDVKVDDTSYTALKLTGSQKEDVTVLIDPKTSLLRRMTIDAKAAAAAAGQDVKKFLVTIDYSEVNANPKIEDKQFAWAPPEGAKDATQQLAAGGGEQGEATALEGKEAPDFALTSLDGKDVKLKDLKGQVIVLDFWATWCGPCRASLPHIDKLYQSTKDNKKIKVFAVNLSEDKPDVKDFVKNNHLSLPVLLDSDGKVGASYMANAIPETVIIGTDGKVKKVFVGFGGEETATEMQKIVEDAAK